MRPWVLEVNHSPSFNTDSPLDESIKKSLILETFRLLDISPKDKQQQKNKSRKWVRTRIYDGSSTTTPSNPSSSGLNSQSSNNNGEEKKKILTTEEKIKRAMKKRTKFEDETMVNYVRIYPVPGATEDPYAKFYQQQDGSSSSLGSSSSASSSSASSSVHQNLIQVKSTGGRVDMDLLIKDLDKVDKMAKNLSRSLSERTDQQPLKRSGSMSSITSKSPSASPSVSKQPRFSILRNLPIKN